MPLNLTENSYRYLEPLVQYWNTTTTPIDKEIYNGVVAAFYQIIDRSTDKFASARSVMRLLELDSKGNNLNCTLMLNVAIRDDGNRFPVSKIINDQIASKPELEENFREYLGSASDMAILLIQRDTGDWMDNFHIHALNRYNQAKYQNVLGKNIDKGWFLNFYVHRNFLGRDEKGNAGFVNHESVALLLPGDWLLKAIDTISGLPDGAFSELEMRNLKFFAENCQADESVL